MNELEKLYQELVENFEIVKERHAKFVEKGNKSAEADVRTALGTIKKLITPYRKASVESVKGLKKVAEPTKSTKKK